MVYQLITDRAEEREVNHSKKLKYRGLKIPYVQIMECILLSLDYFGNSMPTD